MNLAVFSRQGILRNRCLLHAACILFLIHACHSPISQRKEGVHQSPIPFIVRHIESSIQRTVLTGCKPASPIAPHFLLRAKDFRQHEDRLFPGIFQSLSPVCNSVWYIFHARSFYSLH
jgi:hypothetical protein